MTKPNVVLFLLIQNVLYTNTSYPARSGPRSAARRILCDSSNSSLLQRADKLLQQLISREKECIEVGSDQVVRLSQKIIGIYQIDSGLKGNLHDESKKKASSWHMSLAPLIGRVRDVIAHLFLFQCLVPYVLNFSTHC
eukprot:SAG31_NODE_267_length_18790_cov_3.661655_10_plen_138_part_00